MSDSSKNQYTIREVSQMLNLQTHMLRYWETEFEALQPSKDASGRRQYTSKDVAIVRRIQHLLKKEQYTIEGARQALQRDDGRRQTAQQLRALRSFLVDVRAQLDPEAQ